MSKRAIVVAGMVALLLTGISPAGESCGLSVAVDHGCCAANAPEPSSSCCDQGDESRTPSQSTRELDCDCSHPADTPVTIVASNAQAGSYDTVQAARAVVEVQHPDLTNDGGSRSIERRVRSHPPPPVFLFDCSFLI